MTRITFVPERATVIDYVRNAQRCRCGLKNVQRYHWKHRHCHCNHHCHHESQGHRVVTKNVRKVSDSKLISAEDTLFLAAMAALLY